MQKKYKIILHKFFTYCAYIILFYFDNVKN